MRYSKLAISCAVGATLIALVFSSFLAATGPLGLAFLPVGVAVSIVLGAVAYLIIWAAWKLNAQELARKGYRW